MWLKVIRLGIVGFVLLAVVISVCSYVLEEDPEIRSTIIGAFSGAFFAFIFLMIGEWLIEWWRNVKLQLRLLSALDAHCNRMLNTIACNLDVLRAFETFHGKLTTELKAGNAATPQFFPETCDEIVAENDAILQIENLNIVYFFHKCAAEISGLNAEARRWNQLAELGNKVVTAKPQAEQLLRIWGFPQNQLELLRKGMEGVESKLWKLEAMARVQMQSDSWARFLFKITRTDHVDHSSPAVLGELNKMKERQDRVSTFRRNASKRDSSQDN